jgi:hypothetical protein
LRMVASGIQENCPLPALTAASLREQFAQLLQAGVQQQQQEQHVTSGSELQQEAVAGNVSKAAAAAAAATAARAGDSVAAAADINSQCAVSRSNPFAVAFDAAAACDPAVGAAASIDSEAAVPSSSSNNPFDDGFQVDGLQLQAAAAAAADLEDIWPQQQLQTLPLLPPAYHQQQQQREQQAVLQQQDVQLPAIRILQAQRCDVSYDEELHAFTPLSGQANQQQLDDSDVFTYMPTAAVLEQQDRQLWPRRTSSWQRHQGELLLQQQQQQQLEQDTDQQQQQQQVSDTQDCSLQGCQQLEQLQQPRKGQLKAAVQVCVGEVSVAGASLQPTADAASAAMDAAATLSADECSEAETEEEEDAAHAAALAAAAPLDDIELKHRGSPRCCQAQTQPQQQQHLRQSVMVRRAHSCEADETGVAHAGSPSIGRMKRGSSSRSQLPLRRVCSSDAEGVSSAAPGSSLKAYSSSSSNSSKNHGQGSSPKSRRQAEAITAAAAAAGDPSSLCDPPPYSEHLLYRSANGANTCQPLLPVPVGSPKRAAAAAAAGTAAGKVERRVSGSAGSVKLVPLLYCYEDSSSAPGSSDGSSSSRGTSASDADHAGQLTASSSRISMQQRLPTPKASLTGNEDEEQQIVAESEVDVAAEAAAGAAANSLVAGLWQQQQQQQQHGVAAAGRVKSVSPGKAVRFCEWVEQLEFGGRGCGSDDDDSSSVESFTEEQLLEAQVKRLAV